MAMPRRISWWNGERRLSAARPIIIAQPPGRTSSRASRRVDSAPTASNTRSTPRGRSSGAPTLASAPNRSAAARRSSLSSRTPAHSTPPSTTACSVIRPIVPAPITTARSTGPPSTLSRPTRAAWTPLASGSASAPTRASTSSGSARSRSAGTRTASAKPPGRWTPINSSSESSCSIPTVAPAPCTIGLTAARRSRQRSSTPSPTATTRPANSWPMTSGGVRLAWWPR